MPGFDNYLYEDILRPNMNDAAYFILLYEWLEDKVISVVKDCYSGFCMLEGKGYCNIDEAYIQALQKKIDKGETGDIVPYAVSLNGAKRAKAKYEKEVIQPIKKKDAKTLRGSLLWLQKHEAITPKEKSRILRIRKRRNVIVHELLRILGDGLDEDDAKMIVEMIELIRKINQWNLMEIETPILGYTLPEGASPEDVHGGDDIVLTGMLHILFLGEGERYKRILEQVKNNETPV